MFVFEKKRSRYAGLHTIFESKEEAESAGCDFKPTWRGYRKAGTWVTSDDGYVLELLNYAAGRYYFCIGRRTGKQKLIVEKFLLKPGQKPPKPQRQEEEKAPVRMRLWVLCQVVAEYTLHGEDPDYEALLHTFNRNGRLKTPIGLVQYLTRNKLAKHMMREAIRERLKEFEVDEKYVIETIKEAIDLARTGSAKFGPKTSDMIKGAIQLGKYLGMEDEPTEPDPKEIPQGEKRAQIPEDLEAEREFADILGDERRHRSNVEEAKIIEERGASRAKDRTPEQRSRERPTNPPPAAGVQFDDPLENMA